MPFLYSSDYQNSLDLEGEVLIWFLPQYPFFHLFSISMQDPDEQVNSFSLQPVWMKENKAKNWS